jgi:hypothetical protein
MSTLPSDLRTQRISRRAMFDDIRCKRQIKTLVGERHVACITLSNNAKALFPAVADCLLAEFQSICSLKAEVAQKPEIGARRSPNIENSTGTRQPGVIVKPFQCLPFRSVLVEERRFPVPHEEDAARPKHCQARANLERRNLKPNWR